MKRTISLLLMLAMILSGCGPTQQITGSWVNREALPKGPFNTMFLLAITQNEKAIYTVENKMADLITSRGKKVVQSSVIFPPKFAVTNGITKELMVDAIKKAGCDAVFTIALLDTKTEQTYQQGTTYSPMSYGAYGSYYGYYSYYYPQVYSPGYYTIEKTFYLETNFYDVASDQLLWSIQSKAFNPSNLESWFDDYSRLILSQLKKEGLIEK